MEMETYKGASSRNIHSIGLRIQVWNLKENKISDTNDVHWRVDGGGTHVVGSNKCFDIHHNHDHKGCQPYSGKSLSYFYICKFQSCALRPFTLVVIKLSTKHNASWTWKKIECFDYGGVPTSPLFLSPQKFPKYQNYHPILRCSYNISHMNKKTGNLLKRTSRNLTYFLMFATKVIHNFNVNAMNFEHGFCVAIWHFVGNIGDRSKIRLVFGEDFLPS